MSFEINGVNGIYNGVVNDPSVRYGRNAVANHKELVMSTMESVVDGQPPLLDFMPSGKTFDRNIERMESFADKNDKTLKNLPPVNYEYRYMPNVSNGNIDKKALKGAAFEEMGVESISVKDFEKELFNNPNYTAEPLDINKDGKIDLSEYSASILAADMLSKPNPSINNIDGTMNAQGMNAVMEYSRISRAEAATKLYSQIYSTYTLNELA